MRRLTASLTVFLLAAGIALAAPCHAGMIEATRTVLPSGLMLLHAERSHLPLIKAVLLVRSGSAHDPEGGQGTASLTARMLTEGTDRMTSEEFSEAIEFIGASIGAGASRENTTVSLSVLKKDAEKGFELFADAVRRPAFKKRELKRERRLALDSLLSRQERPNFISVRAFIEEVFGGHPYGRYPGGSPEGIKSIKRGDLAAFHREHFTPGNTILAVVGDIDRKELGSLLERYLGEHPHRAPGH
jgi:zinc protease